MSLARPGPAPPEGADRSELFGGAVRCWQPRRGYRFNVDAMLLAMSAFDEPGETVLELGTGVGVVLLVLALNPRFRRLVGLELQPALAGLARRNVEDAGEQRRVTIVEGDLRAPPPDLRPDVGPDDPNDRFDLVVSNPPYYPVADGHLNLDSQRAIARHEVTCRIDDVLARARAAVAPTGRVLLVYPAPRAAALQAAAPASGLAVTAVQLVRSRPTHPPRQVLVALAPILPGAAPPVPHAAPMLDLHDETGAHTGPLADFFRRLERLAALRRTSE